MQISYVNNMSRQLEKLKQLADENRSYYRTEVNPADTAIVTEINTKINELETLLLDLKINNNSSAAKILKWFRNVFPIVNPEASEMFSFQANESSLVILINAEKAFNLNLKTNNELKQASSNNAWLPAFPDDVKFFEDIKGNTLSGFKAHNWFNQNDFGVYLTLNNQQMYQRYICLEFKTSKKLVKDEKIMADVLTEITENLLHHCRYLSKK